MVESRFKLGGRGHYSTFAAAIMDTMRCPTLSSRILPRGIGAREGLGFLHDQPVLGCRCDLMLPGRHLARGIKHEEMAGNAAEFNDYFDFVAVREHGA
jgi:hypothetical protein